MLETMFRENKEIVFAVILLLILKMSSMLYLYVHVILPLEINTYHIITLTDGLCLTF